MTRYTLRFSDIRFPDLLVRYGFTVVGRKHVAVSAMKIQVRPTQRLTRREKQQSVRQQTFAVHRKADELTLFRAWRAAVENRRCKSSTFDRVTVTKPEGIDVNHSASSRHRAKFISKPRIVWSSETLYRIRACCARRGQIERRRRAAVPTERSGRCSRDETVSGWWNAVPLHF